MKWIIKIKPIRKRSQTHSGWRGWNCRKIYAIET